MSPAAKSQQETSGAEKTGRSGTGVLDCKARSPKTSADEATVAAPKLVGARVDALVIAFQIVPDPAILRALMDCQELARAHGRAAAELAGIPFVMGATRKNDFYPLENADLRMVLDVGSRSRWNFEVVLRATHLATHELRDAIALVHRVANGLGTARRARLRRFDMCADFVGFPLAANDVESLLTTRSRTTTFVPDVKDVDEAEGHLSRSASRVHRDGARTVTGIAISPGNDLSARIYVKSAELLLPGREGKREIEHARWALRGWAGEPVTRVEFQHRGDLLDELDLRNPDDLERRLDEVWQHDVRWARLVDPTTATRLSRCQNDYRWQAVQGVVLHHVASPATRKRVRGGASAEQVLGSVRSRLAAIGTLPDASLLIEARNDASTGRGWVISEDEARRSVRSYLTELFAAGAENVSFEIGQKLGWLRTLDRLLTLHHAASARFASVDDVAAADDDACAGDEASG